MLRRVSAVSLLALAACATATTAAVITPITPLQPSAEVTRESLLALNEICGAEQPGAPGARGLQLAAGMGTGGFPVDSNVKEAQDWFDYGLALSHAFYHEDAKTAMRRSVEADPSCALCAWGEAWALGPTLNYGLFGPQRDVALKAAERARALVKPGDEKARRLIDAILARYAGGPVMRSATGAQRQAAQQARLSEPQFGQAMLAIARDYPDEAELAVLAAHSLLIPVRSGDEQGLEPALKLLEEVLRKRPDDTGAIHYYIHGAEFDGRAEDAIAYAERLGRLAPAASHLVHMPAHTFFRAGRYEDAAVVNAEAIGADMEWARAGANSGFPGASAAARMNPSLPPYYAHNLSFGLAGALMAGDAQLALKYAEHAARAYPDTLSPIMRAGVAPRSWVALARYAPERALALPETKADDPRFAIYRHYARGEAMLLNGDLAGAQTELKALQKVKGGDDPEWVISKAVLAGRIAMAQGDARRAANLFAGAAKLQESQLNSYMDPPEWWYPVRRSVAAAYLKAGDYRRAQAEAEKSLLAWKHDPLALWVRGRAELGLGHLGQGEGTMSEARELWRGDFDSITVDAI
jgi:tetratricopeptide (TPR) repeat protein